MIYKSLLPGLIVYCNLKCKTVKGKTLTAKKVTLSSSWEGYSDILSWKNSDHRFLIKKFGVEEDLTILEIDVIHESGYKIKTNQFTEVKASDEKRNKITGAYE